MTGASLEEDDDGTTFVFADDTGGAREQELRDSLAAARDEATIAGVLRPR